MIRCRLATPAEGDQPNTRPKPPASIVASTVLTYLQAAFSFQALIVALTFGNWLAAWSDPIYLVLLNDYFGIVLWLPALIIAPNSFKHQWSRKANIVLQAITIIISIVAYSTRVADGLATSNYDFLIVNPYPFVIAAIILYLLFRPSAKTYYQNLK